MSGQFSTCIDIVGILWYQIYILEDEAVKVIDLGSFGIANIEEFGAIEFTHWALLNDEYPIVKILCLQKRVYIVHEDSELALSVTIWQYDSHIEERMTIERLPLATRQDTETTRHRYWILLGMLLRI